MDLEFRKFNILSVDNEKAFYNFLELKKYNIDFSIKRIYFVQDFKQQIIGGHCHKIEEEVFVIIKGRCTAVINRGHGKEEISFSHGEAVYIRNYVWHEFKDFSEDLILLALSSTNYNPDRSDYVEDYEKYLQILKSL